MAGAFLTTGIGMYSTTSFFDYNRESVGMKLINLTSMFTSHMSVWTTAIALGAIGYYAGKYFDEPGAKKKWRGLSTALGVALISASFAFPVGEKIYNGVHDGLTKAFGTGKQVTEEPFRPAPVLR
jgi:hypothetical protein